MKVALDTSPLYTTRAGVARYVRDLCRELNAIDSSVVDAIPIGWPVENFEYVQPKRAIKTAYRELIWSAIVAPREIDKLSPDLLHHTYARVIRNSKRSRPEVLTIHDVAILRDPYRFRRWHRTTGRRLLEQAKSADRIICISQFTADEVMSLLGIAASQIEVVHNGGSLDSPPSAVSLPFTPPEEYFIFVGSLEPGKNLRLLQQAYLLAECSGIQLPPLLIVGVRWKGVKRENPLRNKWHYLGYQPDSQMFQLLAKAIALVFPTKYEGFGIPILEAQSIGTPVICSPIASLPEVAGRAAFYAEQTPESYLQAMVEMSRNTAHRTSLIEAGIANARRFTWSRCAEQTLAVYRDTLDG
ncbi:MAG: glycosyltransferase family 1 protein [Chthoniobacterales bacterium]